MNPLLSKQKEVTNEEPKPCSVSKLNKFVVALSGCLRGKEGTDAGNSSNTSLLKKHDHTAGISTPFFPGIIVSGALAITTEGLTAIGILFFSVYVLKPEHTLDSVFTCPLSQEDLASNFNTAIELILRFTELSVFF
ncbi:MAG: hypothetical protein ACK5CV_00175 [Bacteroidota bacterium]